MKNESKQMQKPKQKKQKHIFIRVDKQIEPGDLVRCIEDDCPCDVGDIRRAKEWDLDVGKELGLFKIDSPGPDAMIRRKWEVVHKLKVGDLVELHKNGKPMKVTAVYPEDNRFSTPGMMLDWCATDEFRLYQNSKTEWGINTFPIEPVKTYNDFSELAVTRDGIYVGTLNSTIVPNRKAEMQTAVAEMIVELLDKREDIVLSAVYRDMGDFLVMNRSRGVIGEAELSPNDTWDTLTGVYVALSKAAGRKLPDWIYGKEARPDGIS